MKLADVAGATLSPVAVLRLAIRFRGQDGPGLLAQVLAAVNAGDRR